MANDSEFEAAIENATTPDGTDYAECRITDGITAYVDAGYRIEHQHDTIPLTVRIDSDAAKLTDVEDARDKLNSVPLDNYLPAGWGLKDVPRYVERESSAKTYVFHGELQN